MSQLPLTFDHPTNLLPFDGEARLYGEAIARECRRSVFEALLEEVDWRQEMVTVMGRTLPAPRLTAWYGDAEYVYSGVRHEACPMPATVQALRLEAEALAQSRFNAVLLNLYRDGRDSVSWHADNEPGLGPQPTIASMSLGEARTFQLKHRRTGHRLDLTLTDGSLLMMGGAMQHCWLHQIPKTKRPKAPRINLTFRLMVEKRGA